MSDLYDYGPPVQESDGGTPSVDTGETEAGNSGSATTDTGTTSVGTSGSANTESGGGPTVSGLAPATSAINTPTTVSVNGENFAENSVVYVDGVPQPTIFIANGQVRVTMNSTTAKTVQVSVLTGVNASNSSPYTFTAAG